MVGVQDNKFKWRRDESDKLHMCWRYGWGSYMRSSTSRDYALNRIKSAFEGDRVPPTECAVTELVDETDTEAEIEPQPSADSHNETTEGAGKTDIVEFVPGDGDAGGSSEEDIHVVVDSPPKKLCRKMSAVSVDESESPPKKLRPGTAPPSAAGPPRLAAAASPRRPQAVDPAPPASPPPKKKPPAPQLALRWTRSCSCHLHT